MANLPLLETTEVSKEVAEVYHDFKTKMGFPSPPNFIKAQGASLAAARGTWGLVRNVLTEGVLPRSLKEMVFVAISQDRGCMYCQAAHIACCRMLGVDVKTLETLITDIEELTPEVARAVIYFSLKCSRAPQTLNSTDFKVLEGFGFNNSEITEIISMSALAVYANIVADATGVEGDEMFSLY